MDTIPDLNERYRQRQRQARGSASPPARQVLTALRRLLIAIRGSERPIGVTVIAFLFGAVGVSNLLFMLLALSQGSGLPIVTLLRGGAFLATATGLLNLKQWARSIALLLSWLIVAICILCLFSSFISSLIGLFIAGSVIWYFGQEDISSLFD